MLIECPIVPPFQLPLRLPVSPENSMSRLRWMIGFLNHESHLNQPVPKSHCRSSIRVFAVKNSPSKSEKAKDRVVQASLLDKYSSHCLRPSSLPSPEVLCGSVQKCLP